MEETSPKWFYGASIDPETKARERYFKGNKNKTVDQWSNYFWQGWQDHSMKETQFFQQIVWGNFGILMQKSETRSLLITIYKNYPQSKRQHPECDKIFASNVRD